MPDSSGETSGERHHDWRGHHDHSWLLQTRHLVKPFNSRDKFIWVNWVRAHRVGDPPLGVFVHAAFLVGGDPALSTVRAANYLGLGHEDDPRYNCYG